MAALSAFRRASNMARRSPVQLPPASLIDRAIGAVAPGWALQRMKSRAALALAGGYFGGSRMNRPALQNWNPGVQDADSDISPDLVDLRAYSRDLARTSALAGGAINTVVTNVVGTGLAVQPQPDAAFLGLDESAVKEWIATVNREWKLWAESTDCDITRTQNLYGLQGLAFRSALESGDVFALTPAAGTGRPYRLAVQLIEADRVSNPSRGADKTGMVAGVETDSNGAPVAYHISKTHPGQRLKSTLEWTRVAAFGAQTGRRNVLHLFDRRRPGQSRGVPYLASVIEPLKQLTRYSEAEISAAVISAAFAVFVKMDGDAFQSLFDETQQSQYINAAGDSRWDGNVPTASMSAPGKAINLMPGESIESPDLGRPNANFDPFVMSVLRQVGVGLELPFEVLVKHFTASYSAARAALLDAWRFFRCRRDWLAGTFCQPIYELWLEEAVALGRVSAPGFFADPAYRRAWCNAVWVGDGPGSIDPMKEVNAASERIAQGISTIAAESILHDGVDWETKHAQRVRESQARNAAGLNEAQPIAPPPADDGEEELSPARRTSPPSAPSPGQPRRSGNDRAGRQAIDLVSALPHALDAVLNSRHDALQAVIQVHGDAVTANIDARLAAVQAAWKGAAVQPIINLNVAAAEAPSVTLEAVHHHHISVAAAEAAHTQVDVHVPPAAAPVINFEATLPAPDVHVAWPVRETRTTIQRDDSGEMTGSTAIEKSVTP